MKGTRACLIAASGAAIGLLIAVHTGTSVPGNGSLGANEKSGAALAPPQPLDAYGPSDADMVSIMKARRIFEIRCMNRLGFPGENFSGLTFDSFDEAGKSQRLKTLTVQEARQRGYHAADDTARPSHMTAATPVPSVSPASIRTQIAVIYGKIARVNGHTVPPGGCRAQGERDLEHGAPAQLPVDPRLLSYQAQVQADNAPSVKAAVKAWSACMQQAGYRYATPQAAVQGAAGAQQMDGRFHTNPTGKEIATATADARCRAATALYEKWSSTVSDLEDAEIAHDKAQLDRAKSVVQVWITNARLAVRHGV